MHLLDTDVVIWMLRGRTNIIEWVSQANKTSTMHLSVITIAEVYKNVYPAELSNTEEFIDRHVIIDVDKRIARIAGLYWQQYAKKLTNLALPDCLIAATANVYGLSLVSLNIKHFPMQDISVIHPLQTDEG